MIILRQPFLFITFLAFSVVFSASANAGETCPEVPKVSWWKVTSVEAMTAYVDRKHDGDWAPYLKKWQRYEERMRGILDNGKSVVIKSQNITLQGEDLARHIERIAKRVEVTRCIADQVVEARTIEEFNNMDTAAGGNTTVQTAETCPNFSKVVWWETSHAKVASYVEKKHGGDWNIYVEKWVKQFEKMKSLSERGGTAVFKTKKLKLEGENLARYVEAIEDRLSVTKCLARRELVNSGDKKHVSANDG
ncbi:MAG: hypothetical protein H8E36_10995 [Rhodospirillaceae bacterium]|nr:hypothetical protein [Rhodospirillaceae bacterium]MBL6942162.1 hypothetical protein [Rhodospirillales bacterium]